ncbi:glycosyltransferase involved in cell wall biosynthesis [Streptosporangium becharense]|uniref:Glycosyltransferase involved in cell wall biosynthesis n=1 Tax=Streptosporangium becharense TaxID=1816182 RepID=A0A7W9MFK8_9ACTN|nr:glycosyltransferase [Streptosporangium becharense]MBB2912044.1 glycosyltransferase involved in cell wall biosynthesis [Streptosporangium becharense]MBB5818591.1 glycosyltransferase involved in cell wall biosynthesis [Streptosporangium becharense]
MRIALISEHADPLATIGGVDAGGQNVHVAELAAALARRGHEVVVHTRRAAADEPERVPLGPGVSVEHVPAGPATALPKDELLPYMPEFAEHLTRRWAVNPPDVAHAHFWMSGLAALSAAEVTGVPVLQTFHALGTVKRRWQGAADTSPDRRIAAEADIGRRVHAIVATCTDEVNELLRMGVPGDRITVVPCGVDLGLFRPEGPAAPRGARRRVLSLGRMVPRKGVDTVVRAMRHLPDAELVVVGGEPGDGEVARLAAMAAAYGMADRVHLIGSVGRAEVPALMRSADVLVTVPWYEPFGMVPLEAMACGVPVIASAVGGHLDTVTGCGVLVPPRRPSALTRALRDVLDRPGLRGSLAAAGLRRARSGYGWPLVAERTEAVYLDVLTGRRAGVAAAGG